VAETGQPYAYTGDDPLNATDPLGLYSCGSRSASYTVRHANRGGRDYALTCGRSTTVNNGKRIQGYGIRHIQQDGRHFGGNLSNAGLNLVVETVEHGTFDPSQSTPVTSVYLYRTAGHILLDNDEIEAIPFTVKVVVNTTYQTITTAKITNPTIDQRPLDNCNFDGQAMPLCASP